VLTPPAGTCCCLMLLCARRIQLLAAPMCLPSRAVLLGVAHARVLAWWPCGDGGCSVLHRSGGGPLRDVVASLNRPAHGVAAPKNLLSYQLCRPHPPLPYTCLLFPLPRQLMIPLSKGETCFSTGRWQVLVAQLCKSPIAHFIKLLSILRLCGHKAC
jgi:hypothetical protein